MDVTYYKANSEQDKIYYGRISIIRDFVVADADEYGYKYLGVNSCYPLVELIHKDDRTVFLDAVNKLGEGPQSVIVRMKHCSGTYRCLCMTFEYNGHVVSGYNSFDITYTDVMTIHENYEKYMYSIRKYRKILSIIPQIYFEYTLNDDKFVVYTYHNDKSVDIFKGTLKKLAETIYEKGAIAESAVVAFEKFRNNLKMGSDQFEENVPAEIFGKQHTGKMLDIKSTVLYRNDVKYMVVGVMTSSDRIDPEKYYLSEAAKDVGTGLLNKRAISEYALDRINNYGKGFYLLIMDIDDFKTINDTYGHMFGDEVLTKTAEILKSVLSGRGAVGRFGGDEFLMIIENVGTEEELRRVLKTISKHIQWAFAGTGRYVSITTSSGIAKFPEDGENYEDLFKKADKSLYIAKAKGKNRFIIYDEKKHGSVNVDDSARSVGLNLALDREQRIGAISDIILKLNSEGISGIIPSLNLIQRYFDVDGIAVYSGEELKRTFSVGKYIAPVEKFNFFESGEYKRYFNDNGVYAETNILKLKTSCPKVYESYIKQETAEFIQCLVTDGTEAEVMISFDVFNRKRKWSAFETDFLTIIGKLICDIVIRSEQN